MGYDLEGSYRENGGLLEISWMEAKLNRKLVGSCRQIGLEKLPGMFPLNVEKKDDSDDERSRGTRNALGCKQHFGRLELSLCFNPTTLGETGRQSP